MSLDLDLLQKAYASGIFPMADARDDPETFWVEPKNRAIMPLDGFKMSRSLRKTIRADRFRVTADRAFDQVIAICAEEAADRRETWINADIENAFNALHQQGKAHSVECWSIDPDSGDQRLVGGLYGLAIGGAFCGESMFSRKRDASKVALAWLVARLKVGGFSLLDCQFITDHLASLGAIEISQHEYLKRLRTAVDHSVSAIRSPIKSSGPSSVGAGAGVGAGSGAGEGAGVGADGAGAATAGGAAGAGASSSCTASGAEFGELDARLAILEEEERGAVGSAPLGRSSSPGKLISQFLIQTS